MLDSQKSALVPKWKEVCKSVGPVGILVLGREVQDTPSCWPLPPWSTDSIPLSSLGPCCSKRLWTR